MKLKRLTLPLMALVCGLSAYATPVKVKMNNVSPTMSMVDKETGSAVTVGEPDDSYYYSFETPAGEYVLTGYAEDGETINGTIVIEVYDQEEQEFMVHTITADAYNTGWEYGKDYTIEPTVTTREGKVQTITMGESTKPNKKTLLALNSDSYYLAFVPSEAHRAEGYGPTYISGTITSNREISVIIYVYTEYSITVPNDAELFIGIKTAHFIDFKAVEPKSVKSEDGGKTYTYDFASGQQYNYRTWKTGGLTNGGIFTFRTDFPKISFTDDDYAAHSPKEINHSPQSNKGLETGDIFVNASSEGIVKLNVGETFKAHAMRTWQLTNNETENYFIEPDFHYTVVDLDGKPSTGVIEIEQNVGSAWADIKAKAKGTAIVMVTYDGINVNFYSNDEKKDYLGGQFWGAIWPENTAVYVVTVGEDESTVEPNMVVNENYFTDTQKLSGKYVDAEHDVFYYLSTEPGYAYTFTPEGAENVTIAYPTIGEQTVTYSGFGSEGVTKNEDGSYTVLLKEGRQIVRLTDASGRAAYQVMRARPCQYEISNASREGSKIYQPGDEVKIQFSGLFHPANKLAGIYNMSAYITYNGIAGGTAIILGANQYTFGSAAKAQAYITTIPEDFDCETANSLVLDEGVVQVTGYGDAIGNHRSINPETGRMPNFAASANKTYFGALPSVEIPITAARNFHIRFEGVPENADIVLTREGKELQPDDNGFYSGTYGTYSFVIKAKGYGCLRQSFTIGEEDEDEFVVKVEMLASESVWDGETMAEPAIDADGTYLIGNGAEFAYFANMVNTDSKTSRSAKLTAHINLGNYEWTPIIYVGEFDGQGYTVENLYVNQPNGNQIGLFKRLEPGENNAVSTIKNLSVTGSVAGSMMVGGIVGFTGSCTQVINCINYASVSASKPNCGGVSGSATKDAMIDKCANFGEIMGTQNTGGVAGMLTKAKLHNCFNTGNVSGSTSGVGGVVGGHTADSEITNIFNIGEVIANNCETIGACVGGPNPKTNVTNAFCIKEYAITEGQTLVNEEQMRSGEVAYLLGEAFGQEIGVDEYPVIGGMKVLYDEATGTYYNDKDTSGVENIVVNGNNAAVYYNLNGVASDKPFKGINIIKLGDGSVKKIWF